jgi:monoamine oxidase
MTTRRTFVTRTLSTAAAVALGARAAAAAETPSTAPTGGKQAKGTDYDVIIVGGGFSGVAAARDCSKNGLKTLLLEARNRLGGRTFDTQFGPHHVELGGTWVHWSQPFVWSEILRYGLTIEETPGAAPDRIVALVDGQRDDFASGDKIAEVASGWSSYFEESRLVWERPYDAQFHWQELVRRDGLTGADRLRQLELTPLQRSAITASCEAFAHCPIERASYVELLRWNALSMHDFATVFDAVSRYKIHEGTGELVRRIAQDGRTEIRVSTPVRSIEQRGGVVLVTPRDGKAISTRTVILALPVRLLNDIEFLPGLSSGKREAARSGYTTSGTKFFAEVKGRQGRVQVMSPASGRIGLALTYAELPQSTLLVGFAPDVATLDGNDEEDVQRALRAFLPDVEVIRCTSHAWHEDPFSRCTYSSLAPGKLAQSFAELQRAEGRIFMAGGEIGESGWRSCIDGAIGRGARIARDVSQTLLS